MRVFWCSSLCILIYNFLCVYFFLIVCLFIFLFFFVYFCVYFFFALLGISLIFLQIDEHVQRKIMNHR